MAAWHLPGGPVGPPARWAATSNVKVGQLTWAYPANRRRAERAGREGREGSEGQSHEEEEREGGYEIGDGTYRSLSSETKLYLDLCTGAPEFLVTPLLMKSVCLLSQGRFQEPIRPWLSGVLFYPTKKNQISIRHDCCFQLLVIIRPIVSTDSLKW